MKKVTKNKCTDNCKNKCKEKTPYVFSLLVVVIVGVAIYLLVM